VALVVALTLAVAGCSSGDAPPPPPDPTPPAPGSAYFVGTASDGLGATLDLEGQDPVTEAIDAALRARDGRVGAGPVVGVASVVNESPTPVAPPAFIAEFENGGAVPLLPAARVVAEGGGPAARQALAMIGTPVLVVPAGGADTLYVVLRGAPPGDVATVRMVVAPGSIVTMEARRR